MMKLTTPKSITLFNSRTFYARHRRVRKVALPDNVTIKHTYKIRTRRCRGSGQRGKGLDSILEIA